MMSIAENLAQIKQKIALAAQKADRDPRTIRLLAVSKHQSVEKILAAYQAGQTLFGENFLQEALNKMESLAQYPLEWHFIGNIQSNKTKQIAENFSWVQSLSRKKIAHRLSDQRPAQLGPLNICIEVNVSGESTKGGCSPDELFSLATCVAKMPNLRLRGLMAIPTATSHVDLQMVNFKKVVSLQHELIEKGYQLDTLSLGMSQDYLTAIAAGSTMVRIGTALFGRRE